VLPTRGRAVALDRRRGSYGSRVCAPEVRSLGPLLRRTVAVSEVSRRERGVTADPPHHRVRRASRRSEPTSPSLTPLRVADRVAPADRRRDSGWGRRGRRRTASSPGRAEAQSCAMEGSPPSRAETGDAPHSAASRGEMDEMARSPGRLGASLRTPSTRETARAPARVRRRVRPQAATGSQSSRAAPRRRPHRARRRGPTALLRRISETARAAGRRRRPRSPARPSCGVASLLATRGTGRDIRPTPQLLLGPSDMTSSGQLLRPSPSSRRSGWPRGWPRPRGRQAARPMAGLGIALPACGSLDSDTSTAPTLATVEGSLLNPASVDISTPSAVRIAPDLAPWPREPFRALSPHEEARDRRQGHRVGSVSTARGPPKPA
jgi:hypothetical protein